MKNKITKHEREKVNETYDLTFADAEKDIKGSLKRRNDEVIRGILQATGLSLMIWGIISESWIRVIGGLLFALLFAIRINIENDYSEKSNKWMQEKQNE